MTVIEVPRPRVLRSRISPWILCTRAFIPVSPRQGRPLSAAAELGCSQSSVTTHIQALERELGVTLFDRASRHVVLTEVGRRTLEYADRILALASEAKAAVHKQGDVSGSLSVSAPEALVTYRLPEVLREFQALYPRVHLALTAHPDAKAQLEALLHSGLDMAFVVGSPVRSDRVTVKTLGAEEIVLVASPDYRGVVRADFSVKDLAEEQILLTDKTCSFRQIFDRVVAATRVQFQNTLELASIEAIKQCALAGMGLAVLPKMAVATELLHKRLVSLPWPCAGLRVQIQLVRHRKRPASAALQAFWSLTEQVFSEAARI